MYGQIGKPINPGNSRSSPIEKALIELQGWHTRA
jgi:hypothetical protein